MAQIFKMATPFMWLHYHAVMFLKAILVERVFNLIATSQFHVVKSMKSPSSGSSDRYKSFSAVHLDLAEGRSNDSAGFSAIDKHFYARMEKISEDTDGRAIVVVHGARPERLNLRRVPEGLRDKILFFDVLPPFWYSFVAAVLTVGLIILYASEFSVKTAVITVVSFVFFNILLKGSDEEVKKGQKDLRRALDLSELNGIEARIREMDFQASCAFLRMGGLERFESICGELQGSIERHIERVQENTEWVEIYDRLDELKAHNRRPWVSRVSKGGTRPEWA